MKVTSFNCRINIPKIHSYAGCICLCLFLTCSSQAQELSNELGATLDSTMNAIRQSDVPVYDAGIFNNFAPEDILEALRAYDNDESETVRFIAQTLEYSLVMRHPSPRLRQDVVERLVHACSDSKPLIWQQAAQRLLSFQARDFTESAKSSIRSLVNVAVPRREFVLLCGVADLQDQRQRLELIVREHSDRDRRRSSGRWYGSLTWYTRLALARLGSFDDLAYCLQRIEEEQNEVVRVARLLKDIAYTRQEPAIRKLQEYLESDERMPPPDGQKTGTRYCQYALDLLAQIITNFPVESRGPSYTQSEIEACREWMRAQVTFEIIR